METPPAAAGAPRHDRAGAFRRALRAAALAGAALLPVPLPADAAPAPPPPPAPAPQDAGGDWLADDHECRCRAGNACWHYLRSPVPAPADPCACNFCAKVSKHDGTRAMPEGWSLLCAGGNDLHCFLNRHAASWGIACSERWSKKNCCNFPGWRNCPRCEGPGEPAWGAERQAEVERRLLKEQAIFASKDVVIAWSEHFYVVTDIPSLKIATASGSPRVVQTHELAQIYAERCEKAYREFVQHFGAAVSLPKPAGVFLPKRETTAARIQGQYNGSAKTNLVYGGSNDGRVADGFCFNGFCHSLQKAGGDDDQLHHSVRHMVGHLLISCWTKVDGNNRALPRWVFEGAAHWLAKRHPRLKDLVVWCADEGTALSGSGKNWEGEARKIAGSTKTPPVQKLMEKAAIGLLNFDDHVRAWSYFQLGLSEDRERFVEAIRGLRNEKASREAWMEAMNLTPEQWDERWKDRLLGRRPTFGEWTGEKVDDDLPGAAERRALRAEQDMESLAARILAIGTCTDARTAGVLAELFARNSDAVRETLVVVLSRTKEPEALKAIREVTFASQDALVRAYGARVLGLANDAEAVPGLKGLLADKTWLVRAEAALALMRLKPPDLASAVRPLLDDPGAKVRIAAMDALGAAGRSAEGAVGAVAQNLSHPAWQVRSAAAESLGAIGYAGACEALIDRMTTEAGRIRRDCYTALKAISRDDLGQNPENWAKWWKREKERIGGGIPDFKDPEPAPAANDDEVRYGLKTPPNYGLRVFSDRVGYVLDMSNSMFENFEPDPVAVKRLKRTYKGSTAYDISREEIVQSIQSLDPRARFNVCAFSNSPRFMSNGLVPATPDNHGKAESFLRNLRSPGGGNSPQLSNFYEAFKAVLDLPKGGGPPSADFKDTPDTMFFLTDGEPTIGEIVKADPLLAWFNGHNRFGRIRVHTVLYGTSADDRFVRNLALENGGEFIHILEASRGESPAPPTTPR